MAKKGTFNGTFFGNFSSRLHGTPVRFGLLLGQPVEDGLGDVLFAAATPELAQEEGEPSTQPKELVSLLKSSANGVSFTEWAKQHASAVRKLLPAGLEPLGCFVVASEAMVKDLAPLLVPILLQFSEPLVLSIDPSTRKNSFWQLAAGFKPALRPAQMKPDNYKDHVLLWTVTNIDILLPQIYSHEAGNVDELAAEVNRLVDESLKSCLTSLCSERSVPQVVDLDSESILASALPKDCHQLRVAFLRPASVLRAGEGTLRQRCVLTSSALLLRQNVELRHAVAKLREELAASAAERVRLALEECENPGGVLHLPWRSLFTPEDLQFPVWLGDYCMPDEAHEAAKERLGQLLGIQESALEEAPEYLDEHTILKAKHEGTYRPRTMEQAKTPPAKEKEKAQGSTPAVPALAACVGMVVLILAVAIPKLL